ncbi:efflux RND transporter periplasmic adaptor subunit [Prosthecobacter sp. SYSU 5D2]|uniref:efflux RND transporter periplasmic adaptor subunit n=1 Tax=Prosthecobacter sp. SYSU 5D2 TaxID=3134134 RepID=UPI0031FE6BA9
MSLSTLYSGSPPLGEPPLLPRRAFYQRLLQLPAWTFPAFLILALGSLFAVVLRDRLLPATPVNVAVAILLPDVETAAAPAATAGLPASGESGKLLFQAGGWIEPDPRPIYASALTDGTLLAVHVQEGQEVKKGQLLAELVPDDAEIALAAAERKYERAVAEYDLQKVMVSVAEADASAMEDLIAAAEAKLAQEQDKLSRVDRTQDGSISAQERAQARFGVEGQLAAVAAQKSQHAAALAKVSASRAQLVVLEADSGTAKVEVEKMELALSRTRILSPVDGVILELHAAPGQKKMFGGDNHLSATIAALFEKDKLQARVDVPLADARGITLGQETVITSDFLPNIEFRGVVTKIVGSANLQRNTLQAKVRVVDPDPRLRPEMLCRVKFLEASGTPASDSETAAASASSADSTRAVMVPIAAITSEEDAKAILWVVGMDGVTASKRAVSLGSVIREDYRAIVSGVLPGELVIFPPYEGLKEGGRVKPSYLQD